MVLKLVQSNINYIEMDKKLHITYINEYINIVKCKQAYKK
jgi:hypothetical protein